jgi:hypothetical protein
MNTNKRVIRAARRAKTMRLARHGVPFTRSAFTFDKPARKISARKARAIVARTETGLRPYGFKGYSMADAARNLSIDQIDSLYGSETDYE